VAAPWADRGQMSRSDSRLGLPIEMTDSKPAPTFARSASLFHSHQTGIVLSGRGIPKVWFQVHERFRFRKTGKAKELEVPGNLEASGLILPGRAVRLDEIAIDEHAARRESFVAPGIHVRDGLLPAEIV